MNARTLLATAALLSAAACGRDLEIPAAATDLSPPAPVASLTVLPTGAGLGVQLRWSLPDDVRVTGVILLAREGEVPPGDHPVPDGVPVAVGDVFAGAEVIAIQDTGRTYFEWSAPREGEWICAAVTFTADGRSSRAVASDLSLRDLDPPLPVSALSAASLPSGEARLSWAGPGEPGGRVLLVRLAAGASFSPRQRTNYGPCAEGATLPQCAELGDARIVALQDATASGTADDAVSAPGTWGYRLFVEDAAHNHSEPTPASVEVAAARVAQVVASPDPAGAWAELQVEVAIAPAERELAAPPAVTIDGEPGCARTEPVGDGRWTCTLPPAGDLADGQTRELRVEAADRFGPFEGTGQVTVDARPPVVELVTARTAQAAAGDEVLIDVVADEVLGAAAASVQGFPVPCRAGADARAWVCTYRVSGQEAPGPQGVALAFADPAGNGSTAFFPDVFTISP